MITTLQPQDATTKQAQLQPATFDQPSHSRLVLSGGYFGGGRFLVLDENGFVPQAQQNAAHGLYWLDTKHLGCWHMLLNGLPLRLLRSSDSRKYGARFWYGNQAVHGQPGQPDVLPEQTIRIIRDIVISGGGVYERISLKNNGMTDAELQFDMLFGASFVDMFEVRGDVRAKRGDLLPAQISGNSATLGYRGLDNKLMQTTLSFHCPAPLTIGENSAHLAMTLPPQQEAIVEVVISTHLEDCPVAEPHREQFADFQSASDAADAAFKDWRARGAVITVSNQELQAVLDRALRSLYTLRTPTPHGPYVAAGIPWFYDPFGRDGIWVGMQMLPFFPDLAREILEVNAAYQGTHKDDWTLEDVGNIVHEVRFGEMSRLREKPFFRYYGEADGTPLWIMLFCRYVQWTGDKKFARKHWKNLRLALQYVDKIAKLGYHGYLAYGHEPPPAGKPAGLTNRDWKDAGDSIMYGDGELAKPPIATCNVQGYLLQAWESAAELAAQLGYTRIGRTLARKAARLKKPFAGDFWMPGKNFVALALDGSGRQCDVVASNAGHLLRSGMLPPPMARAVADRLQQPDMFNGWAVRTLSAGEKRFNPDSYQDGSVWWHDNGIICDGLMEIGETAFAHKIFKGALDAASSTPGKRLPELDSGTSREESPEGLVSYPVACDPQAWAAGSMFMMLAACLGLCRRSARHARGELHVVAPALPDWLPKVWITNLQAAGGKNDLHFYALPAGGTVCYASDGGGGLRVVVEP